MNNTTQALETALKSFCASLDSLDREVADIFKLYFATGSNSLVDSASGGDAVTVSTALTKIELVNGINLVSQLQNFFGNVAVAQGDYLATCQNLLHGGSARESALSADVEIIGTRLRTMAMNCVELFKQGKFMLALYNTAGLSSVLGQIAAGNVVFGCSTTQGKFISGIVLVQQFAGLLDGQVVSQGDYRSSVTKWIQEL